MWNLPSSIEATKIAGASEVSVFNKAGDEHILASYFKTNLPLYQLSQARPFAQDVSIQALHANALFISLELEIIGSIASILRSGILRFIPSILYPIVQKATDINHSFVQQAALKTMHRIGSAAEIPSLTDLFSQYFELLMENITRYLNTTTADIDTRNLYNTVNSIHCILRVVEQLISNSMSTLHKMDGDEQAITQNLQLLDVIEGLIAWFDANFDKSKPALNHLIEVPLGLLKVFVISSQYLSSLIQMDSLFSSKLFSCTGTKQTVVPWIDSLKEFLVEPSGCTQHVSSPLQDTRERTGKDMAQPSNNTITFMKRTAKVSRRMMSLASFFFSLNDVRIQRYTCEALKYALVTLGRIEWLVEVRALR
jgi:hypothetical protein